MDEYRKAKLQQAEDNLRERMKRGSIDAEDGMMTLAQIRKKEIEDEEAERLKLRQKVHQSMGVSAKIVDVEAAAGGLETFRTVGGVPTEYRGFPLWSPTSLR